MDLLKSKSTLLDITAELTEGVVNGKSIRVKEAIAAADRTSAVPKRNAVKPDKTSAGSVSGDHSPLTLTREELRRLRAQRGWPLFKDVFMVSALDGEDVATLMVLLPENLQFYGLKMEML